MNKPNPFAGIASDHPVHDAIESLLSHIYASGEWDDDHELLLDQWRGALGEGAMGNWEWWIRDIDDESYEDTFATREAAIEAGKRRYADEGRFEIIEARLWSDAVKEGEDVSEFAAQRNHEVIRCGGANDE